MADIAIEQTETPVVEKEVVEVDAPKVVEEAEVVEKINGSEAVAAEPAAESATPEVNGKKEETEEVSEVTSAEEVVEGVNGDSLEHVPEAVKRKAAEENDEAEVADESAPAPEKKSKVDDAAKEKGAAEEVVA